MDETAEPVATVGRHRVVRRFVYALLAISLAGCSHSSGRAQGASASAATTSAPHSALPLDGRAVASEFAAVGMRFDPGSAPHRVSSGAAIRAAAAKEGLSRDGLNARVLLGFWTNAVSPSGSHPRLALADHRLVWLVRFTGLSLSFGGTRFAGHGPRRGAIRYNHELNVMVDADTGDVVGRVSYR